MQSLAQRRRSNLQEAHGEFPPIFLCEKRKKKKNCFQEGEDGYRDTTELAFKGLKRNEIGGLCIYSS